MAGSVAPFVGAWIETAVAALVAAVAASLPSWERGLKLAVDAEEGTYGKVAPFVGAWIETEALQTPAVSFQVAPFVGAWIETGRTGNVRTGDPVAPFVGAWIETPSSQYM